VKSDCQSCHLPHSAADKPLLTQPLPALCEQCHDLKEAKFSKAHLGIAPASMNCMSCHEPHVSQDPKFFQEKTHAPFVGGMCDECHVVGK